jgi:uncharacterized membrane protein
MTRHPRHPWHPAFVHFPIACWVLATLVDIGGWFVALPPIPGIEWAGVSHLLLWGGVVLALPAIVAGVVDYIRLPEDVQASAELSRHVAAMATAWLLFLAAAIWRVRSASFEMAPSLGVVLLELAGSACLLAGGRFAAAVVFERLPTAHSSRRDIRSAM